MKVAMTVRKRVMIFAVMFVASVRQAKMTAVTISFNWRSSCSCRVRIALNLKGLDYEYTAVNLVKGEQNSPGFRKLNPLGYVPVLVDGDVLLSDSFAILLYLAEKYPQHPLLPSDLKTKAINFQISTTQVFVGSYHVIFLCKIKKAQPSVKVLVLLLLRRKHMLLKKFKAYATKEEALQNRPKEIKDPDDWIYLCDLFSSEKLQARSKTYSENRSKMRCNHRGGSKNFIQHKKEKEKMIELQDETEAGESEKTKVEICEEVLGEAFGYNQNFAFSQTQHDYTATEAELRCIVQQQQNKIKQLEEQLILFDQQKQQKKKCLKNNIFKCWRC